MLQQMTIDIKQTYQKVKFNAQFYEIKKPTILPSLHLALPTNTQINDIFVERLQIITSTALFYRIQHQNATKIIKLFKQSSNEQLLQRKENAFLLLVRKLNYGLIPATTTTTILDSQVTIYEQFDFSLDQIIQLKPLSIQHIRIIVQQCAQLLNSARQFRFYSGCFTSKTIFFQANNPARMMFPNFEKSIKLQGVEKFINFQVQKTTPYLTEQSINKNVKLDILTPECIYQTAAVPAFSDSFELGTLIYELWTGKQLFKAENEFMLVKQYLQILGIPGEREIKSKFFTSFDYNQFILYRRKYEYLGFNEQSDYLPVSDVILQNTVYDGKLSGYNLLKQLMRNVFYCNCEGNDQVEELAILKLVWGLIQGDVNKRYGLEEVVVWIQGNLV
ncbi:hypothetical protein SS50377_26579 [Spironucleus salmonicida]|uniref:Protein kinase domain-containing protein n=1 Tax=Spironucleus salmonicida TaxID=348837 RepID=V6LAJ3_9EUKA|nr:hypothetical protein SS50377_26579 [Spironucleus salmonicida]|eukprot:EST41432.1 Hypothetical protein SS50377_19149 [Spironucleus salmonicida]